jgi:toxin ParE1/3/4
MGIRLWRIRGFERYLIFYRPIPDGIEVIRVLHGARDIDTIFEREG